MSAQLLNLPPGRTLLTPVAAAEYLGLCVQTMANWRMHGRGPAYVKLGRVVRYKMADIERWIEQQAK